MVRVSYLTKGSGRVFSVFSSDRNDARLFRTMQEAAEALVDICPAEDESVVIMPDASHCWIVAIVS